MIDFYKRKNNDELAKPSNLLNEEDKEQTIFSNEENDVLDDETVLKINDLYKSYGPKEVLKGLNLEVKKGEVFGFIGKNGIGKSTTIDCIVGLKEYDKGTIEICGLDNKKYALKTKLDIGYVPSEPVTYEMMTGYEYLRFIASCFGMSFKSFKGNIEFLIRKLDMNPEDLERKISEYSHGMKQKICLMASLIHNPKIWILDEPTVGLDIMVYEVLLKMIKDYSVYGKTVFITSHNIELVSKVCDRVAIINDGKVVELLDFNKDPLKRKELLKIFIKAYEKKEVK